MTDQQVGAAFRAVRIRKRLRQEDVARLADVSRGQVSRLERGYLGEVTVQTIRRIAAALEISVTLLARWRGGELDRMLNSGHAAMHEALARYLRGLPDWVFMPEVSYAIYAERGVIDILCWHAGTRTLLIIELKTSLVDVQELLARADVRRRLARRIARERGWEARSVSVWVVMAEGKTNRRRVQAHAATLRTAFPLDGRSMLHWLRRPEGEVAALSFWSIARDTNTKGGLLSPQRVRRPRDRASRAPTSGAGSVDAASSGRERCSPTAHRP